MSTIAKTIEAAKQAKGEMRAGGTDLMDRFRHHVSEGEIVDISSIPELNKIEFDLSGECRIGALVSIDQLANTHGIREGFPGLAKAASELANPQIRRAATLGGALLQKNRCWYYRHEEISCFKKGGNTCPMRNGNHQYGVCFDLGPCVSPHPSTLGMALLAYDAEIEIAGKGRRKIAELYGDGSFAKNDHLLNEGELLTHIFIQPNMGEQAAYFRSISRARAEWPLVEVLAKAKINAQEQLSQVRVVMGGVANIPLSLPKVEAFLNGKKPSIELFLEAGKIATQGANPLPNTAYKVELVEKTIAATLEMAFLNNPNE